MAIYEFECTGCGERFEVNRPTHEHDELLQHPPACPKCGNAQTREGSVQGTIVVDLPAGQVIGGLFHGRRRSLDLFDKHLVADGAEATRRTQARSGRQQT